MAKIEGKGLSFDDVLLKQQVSSVPSRYDSSMDLSTEIAVGTPRINTVLVAANMDTVTESKMAIAMAKHGGIGIIHRFITPKRQAEEVSIVKNEMAIIEQDPITISKHATIKEALEVLKRNERGYIFVTSQDAKPGEFCGIATHRDFLAADSLDEPIKNVMTTWENLDKVPAGTTLEEAVIFMKKHRLEKVPVVREDGTLAGVYTLKDEEMLGRYPHAAKDSKGRLVVGAAIGVKQEDIERAHMLAEAGVDVLVLDIAHGALWIVKDMMHTIKVIEKIAVPVIVGNVSNYETVTASIDWGADGVKVGVGPGYTCKTRVVAGVGMPQITAIMEAREAVEKSGRPIPIVADGGIRVPGDVSKSIGAGANAVMVGSLFAGTEESPGEIVVQDGIRKKVIRGMASEGAYRDRQAIDGKDDSEQRVAEGRMTFVPLKGSVVEELFRLEGGLRSGMTYSNSRTIHEMQQNAKFVEVSPAGANEQNRNLG